MLSINLSNLNNDDLIQKTKDAVSAERKAITSVLHHLHEVEVRRLHLLRGFSSLWEFATHELGYSAGGADRRIKAMRLVYTVPGTEEKITDGSLSLTNASQLQRYFRDEKKEKGKVYTVEQKQELIESVQYQSTRECEKILVALSPEHARKDKERILSNEVIEIRFSAKQSLLDKLKKIKGLIAHKNTNPSYGELFEILADVTIEKLDPSKKKLTPAAELKVVMQERKPKSCQTSNQTHYIPAAVRAAVWQRDQSQCSFT